MSTDFDPRDALRLIDAQGVRVREALTVRLWLQVLVWGMAWLVGFGAIWLDVRNQQPYRGPGTVSGVVLGVALSAALAVTISLVARGARGVGGRTARQGRRVGVAWLVTFAAWFALAAAVVRLTGDARVGGVLFCAGSVAVTGFMYLLCAATWDDAVQMALGLALLVVAVVAAFVGPINAPLVASVGGALAFGAAAVVSRRGGGRG